MLSHRRSTFNVDAKLPVASHTSTATITAPPPNQGQYFFGTKYFFFSIFMSIVFYFEVKEVKEVKDISLCDSVKEVQRLEHSSFFRFAQGNSFFNFLNILSHNNIPPTSSLSPPSALSATVSRASCAESAPRYGGRRWRACPPHICGC